MLCRNFRVDLAAASRSYSLLQNAQEQYENSIQQIMDNAWRMVWLLSEIYQFVIWGSNFRIQIEAPVAYIVSRCWPSIFESLPIDSNLVAAVSTILLIQMLIKQLHELNVRIGILSAVCSMKITA